MDFQDQKTAPPKANQQKVARNPNNANILKGGQVDPRSQLYQRSIAGREQLKDYLSRLSNSGADEADVFMAGVKSLMNRGHGYVGAYLDSKNPGRRYEKNQAMAITDKVMTDEGIGENPGARLTRPKVEDEEGKVDKEATKEARDKRKEANLGRGSGPQQAPGPSAKPVGQQRKEGKRESTGQPLEDSRRDKDIDRRKNEGPVYQPVSKDDGSGSVDVERKWQKEMADGFRKIKEDLKTGAITPEEAKSQISELNSRSKEFVKGGKQEREQGLKDDAAVYKRREDRKKQRDGGAQDQPPADANQTPSAKPSDPGAVKSPGEAKAPSATPQPDQGQQEEKAKWRAPGEGREDTGVVEEVKTGVSGTGGGMLSAQSRPVIGPWSRNENEYKQSITSTFDRLIKEEIESQYESIGGVRDPRKKIGIESKIYSDPKELEYVIKDTIRDFVSKDKDLQGTDFDDFARNHLNKLIAYRTGQDVEEEPKPSAAPQGGGEEVQEPAAAAPKKPAGGLNIPKQPARRGGGGFTPGPRDTQKVKEALDQAKDQGLTAQQVVEKFQQGDLFPGGLVTDTAQTNPLEGGSTPAPTNPPEEFAPSSTLPGAARPNKSPGQKTFLSNQRGKETQILPSSIQVPKPGQGVTDAKSYTQQLSDAGIPTNKIEQAVKEKFGTKSKGRAKSRGSKTINSAEYQEFAQSVRSMMR